VVFSSRTRPVVSIVARPDTPSAWIQLTGAIDMAVEAALADAADLLRSRSLRFIVVDLAAVTFVGSTFAKFLATLRRDHPGSQLVLHNPSRLARVIVAVTGMEGFVVMSGHPVTSPGPDRVSPPTAGSTTAVVPPKPRYPSRDDGTAGNRPGRWEAINPRSYRSGGPPPSTP